MCGFWMLLPEFLVPLLFLVAVALVLILTLFNTHAGYLHLVSVYFKCSSFCWNSSGLEQMVWALWWSEPTTLYLDDTIWLLSLCKYRSVCVHFLYTVVLRLPSSFGDIKMSKRGMEPSCLDSSLVDSMCRSMVFRCSKKLVFCDYFLMENMSSTNLFQR